MKKYEKLRAQKNSAMDDVKVEVEKIKRLSSEAGRVANVAKNTSIIIDDIDRQFEQVTKLNKIDSTFLFFATALQCARQYFLTDFKERLSDQEAAKKAKGDQPHESSDRSHQWYRPSLDEIITSPVPYDAIYGSKEMGLGLSGNTHRFKTLGHDPLLGWLFGTANITTSTMTTWDFASYHVKTGFTKNNQARDKITNNADTLKVFEYTKERLINGGFEGKTAIGTSIIKQGIHLKSDKYSIAGLPIPVASVISPDLSRKLAEYGLDMGNLTTVVKQATFAALINTIIAMVHGLFYDKNQYSNWSLYEVKTRKILSYSNMIATTSNVLVVGLGAALGTSTNNPELTKKALSKMDIGGCMVTLYRMITDYRFIKKIKTEFLEQEFYNTVMGSEF